MAENPEGIGSVKASYGAVCAGAVNRGEFNNCAAKTVHAAMTITESPGHGSVLVVMGACDRHILGVKKFMAGICTGEAVMITSPEAMEKYLIPEEVEEMGGIWEPVPKSPEYPLSNLSMVL